MSTKSSVFASTNCKRYGHFWIKINVKTSNLISIIQFLSQNLKFLGKNLKTFEKKLKFIDSQFKIFESKLKNFEFKFKNIMSNLKILR